MDLFMTLGEHILFSGYSKPQIHTFLNLIINNFQIYFDHLLQIEDKTTSKKSSREKKTRKFPRDQVEIVIYRSCCDEKYLNLSGCKPENW